MLHYCLYLYIPMRRGVLLGVAAPTMAIGVAEADL